VPVAFDFDFNKALAAILYLASDTQVTALDKYKAAKLLFLADKYHLVRFGHPILGDFYKAFDNGPAPQTSIDLLQGVIDAAKEQRPARGSHVARLAEALRVDTEWENARFSAAEKPNMRALSRSEVEALNRVIREHGRKTFKELYDLTHGMAAYFKPWNRRGRRKSMLMRYEDFFEGDSDVSAGAFEEMLENSEIRKAVAAR
jgi:uncharacterized phage-associated protein